MSPNWTKGKSNYLIKHSVLYNDIELASRLKVSPSAVLCQKQKLAKEMLKSNVQTLEETTAIFNLEAQDLFTIPIWQTHEDKVLINAMQDKLSLEKCCKLFIDKTSNMVRHRMHYLKHKVHEEVLNLSQESINFEDYESELNDLIIDDTTPRPLTCITSQSIKIEEDNEIIEVDIDSETATDDDSPDVDPLYICIHFSFNGNTFQDHFGKLKVFDTLSAAKAYKNSFELNSLEDIVIKSIHVDDLVFTLNQ